MWVHLHHFTELEEDYLAALGRALALAQSFETNCKDVLMWWDVSKAVEDGQVHSLADMKPYSERLTTLMLGATVRRLGSVHDVTDQELKALIGAKDARNYFAHEAAKPTLFVRGSADAVLAELPRFRQFASDLAKGDNLISSWSYMFHEKELPPPFQEAEYPEAIVRWILAPISLVKEARLGFS